MNINFGKVVNGKLVFAPDTLGRSLRAPSPWQYHAAGYWEIDAAVPTAPEGMEAHTTGLYDLVTVQEEHIPALDENGEPVDPNDEYKPLVRVVRQRYEFQPIPEPPAPPPRVFSKLYLILALQKRGLYERFKDTLETFSLTDLWVAANELSEAFKGFDDYLKVVKADLGLTDAKVEEILAEAVAR